MLRDAHPAILETVRQAHSIHILGAGLNEDRPAHRAVHDLDGRGWRLVPIHPRDAGGAILGRPIRSELEQGRSLDIVVLFLAPERAKSAVVSLIAQYPPESIPLIWFQPGSEHEEVLEMLNDAGIMHIVDDCIVRFVLRHHLSAANPTGVEPWYLQVQSGGDDGCSVWTVEEGKTTQRTPRTPLEWCGDLMDLACSEHVVPRYIRTLVGDGETLVEAAKRLAHP